MCYLRSKKSEKRDERKRKGVALSGKKLLNKKEAIERKIAV